MQVSKAKKRVLLSSKPKSNDKTVHFLYTFFKQKKYIDIFCLYIVVIVVSKTLYGWGSWIRIKERLFRQYSGGSLLTGSRIQSALVRFGNQPKVLRTATQSSNKKMSGRHSLWLGQLDSNQRMTDSETVALPLGDTPIC